MQNIFENNYLHSSVIILPSHHANDIQTGRKQIWAQGQYFVLMALSRAT